MSETNTLKVVLHVGLVDKEKTPLVADVVLESTIVPALLFYGIDGFSVVKSTGYWKGEKEAALVVTVFCDHVDWVKDVAKRIALGANQECVLVETSTANIDFIGGE